VVDVTTYAQSILLEIAHTGRRNSKTSSRIELPQSAVDEAKRARELEAARKRPVGRPKMVRPVKLEEDSDSGGGSEEDGGDSAAPRGSGQEKGQADPSLRRRILKALEEGAATSD